jgi:hypothetical protein
MENCYHCYHCNRSVAAHLARLLGQVHPSDPCEPDFVGDEQRTPDAHDHHAIAPDVRALPSTWPASWRELWEERAAIRQYDGGADPVEADRLAVADILADPPEKA